MNCPEAVFDALYIGQKLQSKILDFSQYEIHFFSYFSCLLSLYEGQQVNNWRYTFVKTDLGNPFSIDLSSAIESLLASGMLLTSDQSKEYFTLSEKGKKHLGFQMELKGTFGTRMNYLETACDTISIIPFSTLKGAFISEPVLFSANNSLSRRVLLESSNPATKVLHSQFRELKVALDNEYSDLLVPAVVWLEFLNSDRSNKFSNAK